MALITVVLFRESISEVKLPETPEQDKNVFRIPVGMPVTSSTSMEDEDVMDVGQESKAKGKTSKQKQTTDTAEKLSDSDEQEMDDLINDQSKAEKHKRLFDVQPYEPFSCLMRFSPLEVLPRSRFVAYKLWKNEDNKCTQLRNMQNRNTIIFVQLLTMYVASALHLNQESKRVSRILIHCFHFHTNSLFNFVEISVLDPAGSTAGQLDGHHGRNECVPNPTARSRQTEMKMTAIV